MSPRNTSNMMLQLPFRTLLPFLALTFVLSWGLLFLLHAYPGEGSDIPGTVGAHHPLFILAVYAPAISAIVLVVSLTGTEGLRHYLRRVFLWRCPIPWAVFLVFGIPLLFITGAAIKGNAGTWAQPPSSPLFPLLLLALLTGPVEEIGWRGFALPLLQRKASPFFAGLVLGIVWALWHLPAFWLGGTPQSSWQFTPFFLSTVSASLIMTALFNASRGSILLAMLFHFQLNNPLWPDAQPYDTIPFVLAAAVTVWLNRKTMFNSRTAVTTLVP